MPSLQSGRQDQAATCRGRGKPHHGGVRCHARAHAPRRRKGLCTAQAGGAEELAPEAVLPGDGLQQRPAPTVRKKIDGPYDLPPLTDPVGAPIALVDAHRVPRKVVVDHHSRALHVQPFRADVRRHEYVDAAAPECVECLGVRAFASAYAHCRANGGQQICQRASGRRPAGKDQDRLGDRTTEGNQRLFLLLWKALDGGTKRGDARHCAS